jgi:hypothetical protein
MLLAAVSLLLTAVATGSIGIMAAHLLLGVGAVASFGIRPLTTPRTSTAASVKIVVVSPGKL